MNFWGHLRTIRRHKRLVIRHCFAVGLYRQGLLHDLSKYAPVEFLAGVRYYRGNRSPNEIERIERGYSAAWLHHKGRNKHHLEYWMDYPPRGGHQLVGMPMPTRYVVEMFCDRMAASKNYRGKDYRDSDPWDYYARSRASELLHEKPRRELELLLSTLRDQGEEAAFAQARRLLREAKDRG